MKALLLSSLSLFLAILYYTLFDYLNIIHFGGTVLLILLITTLLTGGFWLFRPPRSILNEFFIRLFNREQGDLQAIIQLNEMMYQHTTNLSSLSQAIAEHLYHTIEADTPRIWLTKIDTALARQDTVLVSDYPQTNKQYLISKSSHQFLVETAVPIRTKPQEQNSAILETLAELSKINLYKTEETALVIPLVHRKQLIGLIALGPRWSEEIYTTEDLTLLQTMARQITLAILTAQQVAELRQYPDRIAEAQEAERSRISQDLHDSTQQFLAALPFTLSTSQAILIENPKKAQELLKFCSDHALNASADLRAIRRNLSPEALNERGLVRALEMLVETTNQRGRNHLTFEVQGQIHSTLSTKTQLSLYRVIQQAVENSLKHAQATHISTCLIYQDNHISFTVSDNGIGFDTCQSKKRLLSGHDGLQITQNRINVLNGNLTINSTIGEGTIVQGCIPVDTNH